jgi:hypothetical protein
MMITKKQRELDFLLDDLLSLQNSQENSQSSRTNKRRRSFFKVHNQHIKINSTIVFKTGPNPVKNDMEYPQKLDYHRTSNLMSDYIYPKEVKAWFQEDNFTPTFISALFTMIRSEQRVHLQMNGLRNVGCTHSGL